MAQVVYQGFYDDLMAGEVAAGVDLRAVLVMSDTTIATEPDAQTLSDFTDMDICDGVGYAELDLASVTVAYDTTNDRLKIDAADGDFDGGTDEVLAASRQITRVLLKRYVDGTDANDIPWVSVDVGPYTTSGGPIDVTWHANGVVYIGSA